MGGSENPWASVGGNLPSAQAAQGQSGGGGAFSQIGTPSPVVSAQNSINKSLALIGSSGDQGAINQANQVATHNGGGGWFSHFLNAIDMPRAALVSGVEQAGLGLKQALGNGGPGGSLGGFVHGAENHVTVGHILHTDAGINNKWVDSIGGLVGDAALDPLTYAGGVGEIGRGLKVLGVVSDAVNAGHKVADLADAAAQAKAVAKTVARGGKVVDEATGGLHTVESATAARSAAQAALQDAKAQAKDLAGGVGDKAVITPDTMARMQTRGVSALTPAEREFIASSRRIQMKTGYGLRAPFTGGRKSLTLVPGSVSDPLTGAAHAAVQKLADKSFIQNLGTHFVPLGGVKNLARTAALSGDGEAAAALNGIVRHAGVSQGVSRSIVNEFGPKLADSLSKIPNDVMEHVPAALEGDGVALSKIEGAGGAEGVQGVRDALNEIHGQASNVGLPIGTLTDYYPHQLTEAARAAMAQSGDLKSARRAFTDSVNARTLTPGSQFLGHTLEHGTVDEINQIAHEVHGKDAFDVFRSDPREVLANYVRGMARSIGQQHFANKLDELGVTTSGDMARLPEGWQAMMARAASGLGKQARQSARQAEKVGAKGDRVAAVVDQTAKGFAAPESGKLAAALKMIEQRAANVGHEGPLSSDQISEHGGTVATLLRDSAGSHGEAAQRLGEAANKANEAGIHLGGSNVSLADLGAHFADAKAPSYVHDALEKLNEIQAHPHESGKLMSFYDKALNTWKQYSLAMPGKAARHTIAGPAWYAFIGNVSVPALRRGFATWRTYMKSGVDGLSDAARTRVELGVEHGVFHGHEFDMRKLEGDKFAGSTRLGKVNAKNPLSTKHLYFQKNQEVQRNMQDYWRFAMFNDAMDRGASAADAAQKVRMFMGDPHNITNFERSTVRRAIPFYTFLRQNVPVELKTLATQPGKFVNSYDSAKNETEQWTPKDGIVPQYFQQTLGIRTPLTAGGSHVYLSPDLPFARLGEILSGDKNQLISQTSPLIQSAAAALEHLDTFTGQPFNPTAKAAPSAWERIPGLMEALHAVAPNSVLQAKKTTTNFGQTTPQGQWMVTPQAETIIENLMPLLGQARRAFPSEQNMQGRRGTTVAADLVGQNFRTNDPYQQAGELYRRQAVLKSMIENLNNQGLVKLPYGFQK